MTGPGDAGPWRRSPELDKWAGWWVAVKDGRVIATGKSSPELVEAVHKLRPMDSGKGAVAQYVPMPSDVIVIGVGLADPPNDHA